MPSTSIKHIRAGFSPLAYLKLIACSALVALLVAAVIGLLFHLIHLTAQLLGITNDRFEDLPVLLRVSLPAIGMLLILGLSNLLRVEGQDVGVSHSLTRLVRHRGDFPWQNAVMQFFSAWVALATGFSGGRDGPGLHLGAWVASSFRKYLKLTRAERDLLVRVGMTAAIAAGLHTTVAAVFFVIESIRTESFQFRSLVPLIVSSIVASACASQLGIDPLEVGGHAYTVLGFEEWIAILLMGVPISLVAMTTMFLVVSFVQIKGPFYARLLAITVVTAMVGALFPDVLGLGYDTLEAVERGFQDAGLEYLILFVVLKLLLTSASVAMGIPLGIIAPTLVNGGLLGAACYVFLNLVFPDLISAPISLYVLFGATVLLGGVCNAPIAACVFFLELTKDLLVTLQVACAILISHICKINLWGKQTIFEARLAALGVDLSVKKTTWTGS